MRGNDIIGHAGTDGNRRGHRRTSVGAGFGGCARRSTTAVVFSGDGCSIAGRASNGLGLSRGLRVKGSGTDWLLHILAGHL